MSVTGQPLRIAWISHRYAPCLGGAEGYSRAMVRRFVAAGHAVDVFTTDADDLRYFTDPRRSRVAAPAVEWIDGARVERLPVRHYFAQRYVGRLLSRLPFWPLRCRFESFMPVVPGLSRLSGPYDLVFAVGFPFTGFAYAAHKLARRCQARLVVTPFLHLSTPGDHLHGLYTRPHGMRLLGEADLVVSPTRFEARFLETQGIPADRRLILPMAADVPSVTGGHRETLRERLKLPPGTVLIGQLGALDLEKGTVDLVRAVEALQTSSAAGRPPIHLALAGQASPAVEALVGERARIERPWLHALGRLATADVPDFYAAIDAFAMPSRTDSFGIVYLEAWANGRPVIAAASGGVIDVVDPEQTGLLVPFGDIPALCRAIGRLATEPGLAARLGREGARRVANDGGWDERFESLCQRLGTLVPSGRYRPGAAAGGVASAGRPAPEAVEGDDRSSPSGEMPDLTSSIRRR